jgi:hypothetical protein
MKLNQVVNYALGLVGLGVVVYVAGRAWKASKTSTLGDKAVGAVEGLADEVKGAGSTGNAPIDLGRDQSGGGDVSQGRRLNEYPTGGVAQEESNFAGGSRGVIVTDSRGGWSDASPFMGTPVM